jgi:hypothetical protein
MAMSLKKHAALPASKAHGPNRVKGMKAGGPTSDNRKMYGRNMAKVMNQRSPTRGRG